MTDSAVADTLVFLHLPKMACFIPPKPRILLPAAATSWQQWKFCVGSTPVVSYAIVPVQSFGLPVLQRWPLGTTNFHGLYETHWVGWNCILLCKESALRQKGKQARRIYLPESLMTWLKWET